jgi:hypothetical protein
MIITFEKYQDDKSDKHWYLYEPTWRGKHEDLRLPATLCNLIEEEAGISTKKISFEVTKYHLNDAKILDKIHNEDMEEGRYDSYYGEVYICDIIQLYFPESYPNKLYYKVLSNDKR